MDPAAWARHPRDPSGQRGLVLEAVQVPPAPDPGVLHGTIFLTAAGTEEAAPLRKVPRPIEATGLHVKPDLRHGLRGLQPQGQGKQRMLRHKVSSSPF
jgi:hypothetical protein